MEMLEIKNHITNNDSMDGLNGRLDLAKKRISTYRQGNRHFQMETKVKMSEKNNTKNMRSVCEVISNIQYLNICVIGVPEGEKKRKEQKIIRADNEKESEKKKRAENYSGR